MSARPSTKWRPRLGLIVSAVLVTMLALPVAVLFVLAPETFSSSELPRNFMTSIALILLCTAFVGYVFVRALTGPVRELTDRTARLSVGDRSAVQPLEHHGSREVADLTHGLFGMADALFQRTEYLSTFATHVSHEIKTPLTSIRGAVELMLERDAEMSPSERRHFLENVLEDSMRITLLVNRLRELARAENPVEPGTSSLKDISPVMRTRYPHLAIHVSGAIELPVPMTSENLGIVVSNLLDNASEHGADTIEIEVHRTVDRLMINVSDNGEGISTGNAERVFDLFFTTRRSSGGTGMGLGIVRSTLHAHGGEIDLVRPVAGVGADFRIVFPCSVVRAV